MPQTKELQLKLTVVADPSQGSKAMTDLANQAKKVEDAATRANKALQMQRPAGAAMAGMMGQQNFFMGQMHAMQMHQMMLGAQAKPGPVITPGATAPAGGMFSGLSGVAGRTAGIAGAAAAGVSTVAGVTAAWQQLDNELITTKDALLNLYRAVPLVGGALADLADRLIDTYERLRDPAGARHLDQLRVRTPLELARADAAGGYAQQGDALGREVRDASDRVRAVRRVPSLGRANDAAGAVAGGLGLGGFAALDPRVRAAAEATQLGRREQEYARQSSLSSTIDLDTARGRFAAADKEAQGLGRRVASLDARAKGQIDPGSNPFGTKELEAARLEYAQALKRVETERARLEASTLDNKQKTLALVKATYEVEKLQTNQMKAQVAVLEDQEQKVRGSARQFGLLDSVSQQGVYNAVQRFKDGGRDAVTPEELSQLGSLGLTSEFVGKKVEEDTLNSSTYRKLLQDVGQKDAETLSREKIKLQSEINIKVDVDEQKFAEAMEKALKQVNMKDLLGGVFREAFEYRIRQIENQAALGQITRGQ